MREMSNSSVFMEGLAKSLQKRLRKAEQERDEAVEALKPFAAEHTTGKVAPPRACARAAAIVAKREESQ
jgi:hypothetical protein